MPELPDVEVLKEYVDATALHRQIERAEVSCPELIATARSAGALRARLEGRALDATRRHGKWLFVLPEEEGDNEGRVRALLLHFGMTGTLVAERDVGEPPAYACLVLHFADESRLSVISKRKLGRIDWTDDVEAFLSDEGLGPDALDLDREDFAALFRGRRGTVKGLLMNQGALAGIGNEYSDEILFQARVHPRTPAADLGAADRDRLFETMHRVVGVAVAARVDPERMPADFLTPHREPGTPCPRCGEPLVKETVVGRSAYLCPAEQSGPA